MGEELEFMLNMDIEIYGLESADLDSKAVALSFSKSKFSMVGGALGILKKLRKLNIS